MATIKEFSMYPIKKLIDLEGYFTAFDTIYPKNYYFPGEMHDFWEMVYVKGGSVTATGDANIYNLQKRWSDFPQAYGISPHLVSQRGENTFCRNFI